MMMCDEGPNKLSNSATNVLIHLCHVTGHRKPSVRQVSALGNMSAKVMLPNQLKKDKKYRPIITRKHFTFPPS